MDHKYLSYAGLKRFFYTKILKQINLKIDKTNGDISNTKVRSVDNISTEFPDPVAGESTKTFLGKVKKCLADWKAIKSTLLTLSMLTNQYENSTSKISTSALVYALKQSLDTTNSDLALKANASDLANYCILAGGYTMYAQDDLNNYLNVGVFHCATSNTAQYISNQPSSSKRAFRMVVEDSAGVSSYRRQTLRYFNDDIVHSRTYNADNHSWSVWSSK